MSAQSDTEQYGNVSDSTVSITNKYFKFNAVTADELNRPTHVRFLIDTDTKRFAIEVCDAEDRNAVVFPSPKETQEKRAVLNVTKDVTSFSVGFIYSELGMEFSGLAISYLDGPQNSVSVDLSVDGQR